MTRFVSVLVMAAIMLGVVARLLQFAPSREVLAPDAENTVQSFVSHLSARHFENALAQLDDSLKQEVQIDGLRDLNDRLVEKFGEYEFEPGGSQQGDESTLHFDARIKTTRQGEQEFPFELERDPQTQLWKISSLEELEQKIQAQ